MSNRNQSYVKYTKENEEWKKIFFFLLSLDQTDAINISCLPLFKETLHLVYSGDTYIYIQYGQYKRDQSYF